MPCRTNTGEIWEERVPHESIAVCGLLHDLCKIDFYKQDFRNVKENGEWVRRPYYAREELFPFGHGEKSVYIISSFMRLTREEAMAINWHMGGFDTRVKGWDPSISEAYDKYPLAVLMHVSDLEATYIDEKTRLIKKDGLLTVFFLNLCILADKFKIIDIQIELCLRQIVCIQRVESRIA